MKRIFKACVILCAAMAVLTLVMGIRVLMGGNFFIGIRLFNIVSGGGFTGFMGNLLGIAITFLGFGSMALFGFNADSDVKARKDAFIYGCAMTLICLVSIFFAIANKQFTMGDLTAFMLPAVYTFTLFKTA